MKNGAFHEAAFTGDVDRGLSLVTALALDRTSSRTLAGPSREPDAGSRKSAILAYR